MRFFVDVLKVPSLLLLVPPNICPHWEDVRRQQLDEESPNLLSHLSFSLSLLSPFQMNVYMRRIIFSSFFLFRPNVLLDRYML